MNVEGDKMVYNIVYKLLKYIRDMWFIVKFKLDESGYDTDSEELTRYVIIYIIILKHKHNNVR